MPDFNEPAAASSPAPAPRLYLASASPRRRELLALLDLPFETLVTDVPEVPAPGEPVAAYALRVAHDKARAAAARLPAGAVVLAADTDVALGTEILGKPADEAAALAMLAALSGQIHTVVSAVVVRCGEVVHEAVVATRVEMGMIGASEARAYWAGGEPRGKAGGYAIQGRAARWVRRLDGSYTGVVGLPLVETAELLARFGFSAPPAPHHAPSSPQAA